MGDPKTILIVDDEPDVCTYISTLLEDHGYATISAKDGDEALGKLQAVSPALITLDISMPEKSGVKLYREIKEDPRWKKIPVIIITGISDDFQKFISTRRQVPPPEGYLSKPINPEEILELIQKLTS
jgi:CheY-like chemotaxis protein